MLLSAFLVLISFCGQAFSDTNAVLCYYESWEFGYRPEDINTDICTHISYAFMGINNDGSLRMDGDDDVLNRISALKQQNPNLKVIISVGGWSEGSAGFSRVASNSDAKANMAQSALYYLQKYNFDGIDIDWEYPGQREGSSSGDKENFIDMLWVLRNAFNDNGGYLITTAVSSSPTPSSYNVNAISKVVDFINVMTYDFHSSSEGKTGQNSPLYASSSDSQWERDNVNCDAAINNWINGGADPQKLTLGLGFYGKSYTLRDPNNHVVNAPTSGEGRQSAGSYAEICQLDWIEDWDDEQKNPYKYSGDQWIGYDNPRSIALKVQYAKSKNLGGVMMWAVDEDDKSGACGAQNALLQTIKDNL